VTDGKPGQGYCGEKACQAARKREWSREKYASDPDYRINQKESTDAWLDTQGGAAAYYRDYRRRRRKRRREEQEAAAVAAVSGIFEAIPDVTGENAKKAGDEAKEHPITSLFAPDMAMGKASANRDAGSQYYPIKTGLYEILALGANKDATIVEIRMISNR